MSVYFRKHDTFDEHTEHNHVHKHKHNNNDDHNHTPNNTPQPSHYNSSPPDNYQLAVDYKYVWSRQGFEKGNQRKSNKYHMFCF